MEFQYQGVDRAGKKVSGKLDAASEGDLRMLLRSQGVRPTQVSKVGALNQDIGKLLKGGAQTVAVEHLVTFTRQLHVLISSGIPLVQALEVLSEQSSSANLRNTIAVVKEKVSQGNYLWEALNAYPKIFPKLYVSLIRAGEASGSMDQILKRLTQYIEEADRLKRMTKSAMMYPIVVVSIGMAVIAAMMIFVIPKFEDFLKTSGQELPLPTQIVINVSHFMINNVLFLAGGAIAAIYLGARYFKSPEGRAILDRTSFNLPLFGPMVQKSAMARFSRTLQTLLSGGINLIDAIDICRATVDNAVLEDAVGRIRVEIEAGKTLGSVMSRLPVFPKMAVQMIAVGESTGNLDKMLEKIADLYEDEVKIIVSGLSKLIEPFVLLFLGLGVGAIMIAMYLPVFKMAGGA